MIIMASQITYPQFFVQPFVKGNIKENIEARVTGPFWWQFTGHRWIPLTKGQ